MKKFDLNGLRLAEYQAKIFEKSVELNCSTAIFMRRFFHSNFLDMFDKNDSSILTLCVEDAFYSLNDQFGNPNYGQIKEDANALFWLGYFYRYISYTRNVSTRMLMKTFKYSEVIKLYYVFHTQSMEWCVESLLEKYNLDIDYFDQNLRLKKAMSGYYRELIKA